VRGLCVTNPAYAALNNTFERALVTMHKMPKIWELYLNFLVEQRVVTKVRRACDRALASLAVTQHERIWTIYLVRPRTQTSRPFRMSFHGGASSLPQQAPGKPTPFSQQKLTKTRRRLEDALRCIALLALHSPGRSCKVYKKNDFVFSSLPPTHTLFSSRVQGFIRQVGIPVDTARRVYRRYLKFEPGHAEEYIEFLRVRGHWDEAGLALATHAILQAKTHPIDDRPRNQSNTRE
jgi:hypothetical protein